MSITDELREWAKTLTHWWYDPVKDEYTYTTGTMPPSIDAIRLDSNIIAIADRIDAEHEREMEERADRYSELRAKMNNCYIELPVDADGVPIRVGDYVEETDTRLIGRAYGEVVRIVFNRHTTDVRIDTGLSYADRSPQSVRHITKKPTVEDVLREFGKAWVEWEDGSPNDPIAKYAAKLRLVGDAE